MTIDSDTKDWTWVLRRPCPECGFDTQGFAVQVVPEMIMANAAAWQDTLTGPGDVRTRPVPGKWSASRVTAVTSATCQPGRPAVPNFDAVGALPGPGPR